jgi:hypothetical protein
MTAEQFWELIEQSRQVAGSNEAQQEDFIREKLKQVPVSEILDFQAMYFTRLGYTATRLSNHK